MSKRRREMRAKKESRRQRRLEAQGRMVNGVEIPSGAIPADISKQTPAYFSVRYYYRDHEFTCTKCGTTEIWTAQEQKWYFEEIKAHPRSVAKYCRKCRKQRKMENDIQRRSLNQSLKNK